jgi:hypothetical protein
MNAPRNPTPRLAASLTLGIAALLTVLTPDAAHAADDKKAKPEYMPFSGLAATVLREDGVHGFMSVDAGVDIPDVKLRDQAALDTPRLYDAYGQVLQAYGAGLSPGHVPDVDYLGRQLQAATDRVLGRSGARLLLGGVMVN